MSHPGAGPPGADARLSADERLARCAACPRRCGVDRRGGQRGWCGALGGAEVAAVSLHRLED